MPKFFTKFTKNRSVHFLIIVILTLLAYSNIFQNQFVIDDKTFIVKWSATKSLSNIPKFFAGQDTPTGHEGVYRPLRAVVYAIAYKLWGENVWGYHLFSLSILLTSAILIYLIVENISKKRSIAFISSLLFGIHPINTEAITYITDNFDIIGVVSLLASFYLYLKSRKNSAKLKVQSAKLQFKVQNFEIHLAKVQYYGSIALALVAFFTYELTLILPLLITLYDLCFQRQKRKFWRSLPYFIGAFGYGLLRIILQIPSRGQYLGGSFYHTMLTMVRVVIRYLTLLVFPVNLSINQTIAPGIQSWVHPLAKIDRILSQSIFDAGVLIGLALIIILVILAVRSFKKKPLVSFAIFWFFIGLLPVMYLVPQGSIMQERYIYLSAFGFVLLVGILIDGLYHLVDKQQQKGIAGFILLVSVAIIFLAFSLRTFKRNADWRDTFTVWLTLAKTNPDDVIANFYTARNYAQIQDYNQAILYYQKVISLESRMPEAYTELGQIYEKQGKKETAKTYYQKAFSIYPDFTAAKNGLDRLLTGKTSTPSAQKMTDDWTDYLIPHKLMFRYPKTWKTSDRYQGVRLKDQKEEFTIDIRVDKRDPNISIDDYLAKLTPDFPALVEINEALFSNMDKAYLKSLNDNKVTKLQFFLFKGTSIIELTVWPANVVSRDIVNRIIESMVIIE